jgi:hypothetical protein
MSNLHARLNDLATSFADAVLDAIRSASLEELTGGRSLPGGKRTGGASNGGGGGAQAAAPRKANGRLARRSAEDVAKTLDRVVAAVKKSRDKGMRAEDIRKALQLDVREVPRVLKEGLARKVLRSKGQKRATTYFSR